MQYAKNDPRGSIDYKVVKLLDWTISGGIRRRPAEPARKPVASSQEIIDGFVAQLTRGMATPRGAKDKKPEPRVISPVPADYAEKQQSAVMARLKYRTPADQAGRDAARAASPPPSPHMPWRR